MVCQLRDYCSRFGGICQCSEHHEEWAELQAESLAAADLDPDWPADYE